MAINNFEKGDWVSGSSREGELVYGYVEYVYPQQEVMKVHVINSDNNKVIGNGIWILIKSAEKLPFVSPTNKNELLSLIDLALLTKDKQWFMELSKKLKYLKKTPKAKKDKLNVSSCGTKSNNIDKK